MDKDSLLISLKRNCKIYSADSEVYLNVISKHVLQSSNESQRRNFYLYYLEEADIFVRNYFAEAPAFPYDQYFCTLRNHIEKISQILLCT